MHNSVVKIQVCYYENPLFQKSTISTNPKPNPKTDPNHNLNLNPSTVACICTMHFQNSGPLEWQAGTMVS